jgi:hypothetical protein
VGNAFQVPPFAEPYLLIRCEMLRVSSRHKADRRSERLDVNFLQSMVIGEVAMREVQLMPSRICCSDNHSTKGISIHEAAVAVSEGRAMGLCKRCGKELQFRIDHIYANDPGKNRYTFTVTRAVRLATRLADGENYDPFLLVLREIKVSSLRYSVSRSGRHSFIDSMQASTN